MSLKKSLVTDIPEQIDRIRKRYPEITIQVTNHIGVNTKGMVQLLTEVTNL